MSTEMQSSTATVVDTLSDLSPGDIVFVDAPDPEIGENVYPKGTVGQVDSGRDCDWRTHVDVDQHGPGRNFDLIESDNTIQVPDVGEVTIIRYRENAPEEA